MLLAKILSLHSLNLLALLVYCYLGSVQAESTVLNVHALSVASITLFFFTSLLIIYRGREVTYPAIFSNRKVLILILLALVATLLTKTTIFLIPILFAITALVSELRLLLKYYLFWSVLLFLSLITLQASGIITGGEMIQASGESEVLALSLGFGNPNGAFTYLFSILIAGYVLLINSPRKRMLFTVVALASIVTIYSQTLSRTGLLCCLLVVLLGHVSEILPWKKIKTMLPALFIIFALGSVFLALFHGQMGDTINDLLSNRPYWWNMRVEDGALYNLLGNADSFAKNYTWWLESAPLDSFFLRIWFSNGLLILIIFFIFFRIWSKGVNNSVLVLGTLVALLYGFSEYGILSNPGKNIILLLMMTPVFSKYMIDQKMKSSLGGNND